MNPSQYKFIYPQRTNDLYSIHTNEDWLDFESDEEAIDCAVGLVSPQTLRVIVITDEYRYVAELKYVAHPPVKNYEVLLP